MKHLLIVLPFIFVTAISTAQKPVTYILTDKEVNKIFTDEIKRKHKIDFSIFRAYQYTDKSGQYFTVLTESRDTIGKKKDTFSFKVKAITLKNDEGKLSAVWEVTDSKKKSEEAIWFWSKYISFSDVNDDAVTDPILIYGTAGLHHFEDGRVFILIFYLGQKVTIRQQNGTLDFERKLQIEPAFYKLPKAVQKAVTDKMIALSSRMQALFPVNWQKAMAVKKTVIKN